jgi:hypothetical protein
MNDEVLMNTSYKLSEPDVVAMQLNGRGSKSTLIILLLIGAALVLLGLFTGMKLFILVQSLAASWCILQYSFC